MNLFISIIRRAWRIMEFDERGYNRCKFTISLSLKRCLEYRGFGWWLITFQKFMRCSGGSGWKCQISWGRKRSSSWYMFDSSFSAWFLLLWNRLKSSNSLIVFLELWQWDNLLTPVDLEGQRHFLFIFFLPPHPITHPTVRSFHIIHTLWSRHSFVVGMCCCWLIVSISRWSNSSSVQCKLFWYFWNTCEFLFSNRGRNTWWTALLWTRWWWWITWPLSHACNYFRIAKGCAPRRLSNWLGFSTPVISSCLQKFQWRWLNLNIQWSYNKCYLMHWGGSASLKNASFHLDQFHRPTFLELIFLQLQLGQ